MRAFALFLLTAATLAADGNRLVSLDDNSPFWPTGKSPKFVTPQWIGEPGVDAVVILAIDDMREPAKYEAFLRSILDRLKKIDGRAPVSIMTNNIAPEDPQLAAWLKEGVSLDVHTLTHPCPTLGKATFDEAVRTYHGGVDLLASVPGNRPIAFRMPCCDSMNSASPRFFAEIFNKTSGPGGPLGQGGRFLAADSSVFVRPGGDSGARFAKYFPSELKPPAKVSLADYAGFIEDYPYPFVIGKLCWEFPCMTPSDWQAFNALGPKTPQMLEDWKAALDWTVDMQGVMTTVFHPHGWSDPAQWVGFIDYAQEKYGNRVKFLTFREAVERLEKHALAGSSLRHPLTGGDRGVRLLDVDDDGFMDVVIGNDQRQVTRIWSPKDNRWSEVKTPTPLISIQPGGSSVDHHLRFGVWHRTTVMLSDHAWVWRDGQWKASPELVSGLPERFSTAIQGRDLGVRMRDFDRDGDCEIVADRDIFTWSDSARQWKPAGYTLPDGCSVLDEQGRDNGLRFVDLNGDGYADVFQSNEHGHAIYLWAGKVRNDLGWTLGWPHKVSVSVSVPEALSVNSIAPFVKGGMNNGAWFHSGHAVWQNEDTLKLDAYTLRRAFKDLIAYPMPPPKSPQDSLAAMRPRPGFTVELVAAEPLVESPVAFEWDGRGRLWVVEMRDYPSGMDGKGMPGGVIKVLSDTDGDGRYDQASAFADGLPFPTGVFPWRDGVIVAAAPDILYLQDTNDDGKSDERRVLFTGFRPGNQQHRMNGFEWGLDGWLYGANGDSGGNVRAAQGQKGEVWSISGRDFRFHPGTGAFAPESGNAQYGRRRDDWGNWFGNNNPTWLWHYTIEDRYLRRNPKLAVKTTRKVLANYADSTRVFPAYALDAAPTRMNQPQTLGHATSANSPTPYRDDLFGADFATSVFISEPVYNVVHREVLAQDGMSFLSRRAEDEKQGEFLASTDQWFRPTMLKTGPDGALYIADMYRFVLEHPEWIAPETQSRLDLRAGADKGRIWRVLPTSAKLRTAPDLSKLTGAELAHAIDSANGWQRDTAQRLLIERGSTDDAALVLRRMLRLSKNPKARLQALATLDALGIANGEDVRAGLRDRFSAVRSWALRVSEGHTGEPELLEAVLALVDDPDLPVRCQLAFSLGAWRDPRAREALEKLAISVREQPDLRIPIQSSLAPGDPLFTTLNTPGAIVTPPPILPKPTTPDRAKVIANYADVAQLKGDTTRGQQLFKMHCALCHRLKGDGKEVGPDLAMTVDKPVDWMLIALFDPSAAVEPRYRLTQVRTKDGAESAGIVSTETGNNITLKLPGGDERAILRDDITSLKSTGPSLMPEGLESALKSQDVADLLAWIRAK